MQAFNHAWRVVVVVFRTSTVVLLLLTAQSSIANPAAILGPFGAVSSDIALRSTNNLVVDSQLMRRQFVDRDYAFSVPAGNVYRFEVRKNDFGWTGDKKHGNRRSELISEGERYYSGQTLWSSFAFVVGPEHSSFDSGASSHNQITQWHSVDVEVKRRPIFDIQLKNGHFVVATRSENNDSNSGEVHYSAARPADGAAHNVVVAALLGKEGHLDVWLDGTQIVDTDTPIGYYKDDDGNRALAYPHWGIYQSNVDSPAVVYHANIEWGLRQLSNRVTKPLEVAIPPRGWV